MGILPPQSDILPLPLEKKKKKEEKPKENCQRAIPDGLCGAGGFRPP